MLSLYRFSSHVRLHRSAQTSTLGHLLAGSSLASLELLKVPIADLHVATVLIHAVGEALGSTSAVVGVPGLVLGGLSLDGCSRRCGSGLGGAAGEEATDGVADRRTDSNTAGRVVSYTCIKE